MLLIEAKDYNDMSRKAANIISAQVIMKPHAVLGLATGSTPVGAYKQLVEWYNKGDLDFANVTSVNLDEYKGLSPENDQSYRYFMNDNLFNHINIKMENTHVPCGTGADHWADARAYDEAVEAAGGIDLQLLGIGHNGHIGFNEPNDKFIYGTNIVKLTRSTIDANKIYFPTEDDMPKEAISFGIGGIMKAKAVILLALGKGKAQAIHDTVHGEIDPKCPASILKAHPNTIIMVDEAAGSML